MKAIKIIAILLTVYVGIVVTFESLLGYFQPVSERTLVITTTDEDGVASDRVLARLINNGELYVAVNHWPRAWYYQVLKNPNVQVEFEGETGNYMAVTVGDEEYDRVDAENKLGPVIRFLTGFPPRYILRLDPG